MVSYLGVNVSSAEEVDTVTDSRIKAITGGINEEMKVHRQSLWALSVLGFPGEHGPDVIERASILAKEAGDLHEKIEMVVKEGKIFKKENGLS